MPPDPYLNNDPVVEHLHQAQININYTHSQDLLLQEVILMAQTLCMEDGSPIFFKLLDKIFTRWIESQIKED